MTPDPYQREREKLSPYERIMAAARKGKGVHLSVEEVLEMSIDDAISTAAYNIQARRKDPDYEP